MAVIYLKHPKHGAKIASSPQEAQADKANGWIEFSSSDKAKPQAQDKPVVNALPLRRSRGRPRVAPQEE